MGALPECAEDEAGSVGLGGYFPSPCPRRQKCLVELTVSLPLYPNIVPPQSPKGNGFCVAEWAAQSRD